MATSAPSTTDDDGMDGWTEEEKALVNSPDEPVYPDDPAAEAEVNAWLDEFEKEFAANLQQAYGPVHPPIKAPREFPTAGVASARRVEKHYGPGPHKSGSEQAVHGRGGRKVGTNLNLNNRPRYNEEFRQTVGGEAEKKWNLTQVDYHGVARAAANYDTLEEYIEVSEKAQREMLRHAEPCVRCERNVLKEILDDGRIKNQHEAKSSAGYFNPKKREDIERSWFGYGSEPRAEWPVYGYLADQGEDGFVAEIGHDKAGDGLIQYGEIVVRLKPEILDRTTYTFGDSLNENGFDRAELAPAPVNAPHWTAGDLRVDRGEFISDVLTPHGNIPYVEAQFHGGVSTKDIAEVILPVGNLYGRELGGPRSSYVGVISRLKQHDIPYRFVNLEDGSAMPEFDAVAHGGGDSAVDEFIVPGDVYEP